MKNCLSNQSLLLAFNADGSKSVPDSATGAAQGDAKPAEEKRDQFWMEACIKSTSIKSTSCASRDFV
jgi:hypothetical protein